MIKIMCGQTYTHISHTCNAKSNRLCPLHCFQRPQNLVLMIVPTTLMHKQIGFHIKSWYHRSELAQTIGKH